MEIIYLNDLPLQENPSIRVTNRGLVWDEEKQRVLMNKEGQADGGVSWELPGGGIDEGEDIEVSTVREIKEETGIETTILEKAGVLRTIADDYTKNTYRPVDIIEHHVYLMKPVGGNLGEDLCHDEDELIRGCEAHWLALDDAIEKAKLLPEENIWRLHTLWGLHWLYEKTMRLG